MRVSRFSPTDKWTNGQSQGTQQNVHEKEVQMFNVHMKRKIKGVYDSL